MIPSLISLYADQDLSKVRFTYPKKFIFLCGGVIAATGGQRPLSLRDYLYRVRRIQSRLHGNIVLAETATQLYRDTSYNDLISYEEDIAKIAAVVLVIPESPGSLAELGAFSTSDTIRQSLRVIMEARYSTAESFIRFGPIRRIINQYGRGLVGFYPWKLNNTNRPVINSILPHYQHMIQFINLHLGKVPASPMFPLFLDGQLFCIAYWIIYLSLAISTDLLEQCVMSLLPRVAKAEISNKIYCMILAGWVEKYSYADKDYYFVTTDRDPFGYSYKPATRVTDTLRRKSDIAKELQAADAVPKAVLQTATKARQ